MKRVILMLQQHIIIQTIILIFLGKYLIEALNLLKEMVFFSKLDSKEIEKEKQVVIEEIN